MKYNIKILLLCCCRWNTLY